MKISITNINCGNEYKLNRALGFGGYGAGAVNRINECEAELDMGSPNHRKACHISDEQIAEMFFQLIAAGLVVARIYE